MTDTQTHTNGIENGLEEDLTRLRPADIDADVKEMERRKRVEMIMNSKLFREELERIIEMQMKDGNGPAGLLQQISDMMGIQAGKLHATQMFRGSNCVTPINDIRGVESMGYAKGEKHLRCKLASVFRLMDLYGWSQGIHNQITVRLNQDEEHFLVNPYGMLYNEITASSLVKVDMQGNVVEPGTTNFSVNTQVFLLHSSIHASRPDVKCIIHIHTPSVLAVSSLKCGLLPLCQEALVVGEVSQHPFVSGIFEPEEREKIIRNLGPTNKILLLNNHGALCCGETVEEAFYNVYNTVLACETQIKLMPIGIENLVLVNDETRKQVYDAAHRAPEVDGDKKVKHFRVGELEFEALIRMLDNAGFRTGYIYRHPLVKGEVPKPKNDVEVPPAVSSLGYIIEEEKLYKQGNWKKYVDGRNRLDRTKWLNSPNVYQKVEILETGTPDPKKITKWVDQNSEEWVAENSPTHSSTPVKIDSALQFVPKNTNPKEFKNLQQQIKKNRLADKITSGPQSHILEGVTWEEAKKLQDANITQTGDQVILVGAASKGIIQRNFQHNALVYKTPYAKNPFDSISDKDIEDYKRLIERKQRGDTDYEESQSESEAVSSRQEALRHIKSPLMSPQSATSETEEESRDEPRVLRIETKTAPQPIQAEVVLSDAEFDTTDARVERSQSARYPKAEKPESVTIVNSFRKSWSLKRDKDKNKDIENSDLCFSRVMESSLTLTNFKTQPVEPFRSCIARITSLKQKPILIDTYMHVDRRIPESDFDPCSPSRLYNGECEDDNISLLDDCQTDSDTNCDLKRRLNLRKKLIYSAKLKFLGLDCRGIERSCIKDDNSPRSRVCSLISEIRDKINEIMSPVGGRHKEELDVRSFSSLKWVPRRKFVERNNRKYEVTEGNEPLETEKKRQTFSHRGLNNIESSEGHTFSDHALIKLNSREVSSKRNFIAGETSTIVRERKRRISNISLTDDSKSKKMFDLDEIGIRIDAQVIKSLLMELVHQVDAPDEEMTRIAAAKSVAQTCSFAESTETEWYYSKTILKLDNSQTVLEVKELENERINMGKQSDTGIETDFTSEIDNRGSENDPSSHAKALEMRHDMNVVDETEALESSALNKSSETDSSVLKSSSGRTSIDIDTSSAFKTEAENSEKQMINLGIGNEGQEISNTIMSCSVNIDENPGKKIPQYIQEQPAKLPGIPESPEFTNVDTEDAPITSSSKGSSPEMENVIISESRNEPVNVSCCQEVNNNEASPSKKKKKRGKKRSSTKITVKKEVAEKDSREAVVSEIKLTIYGNSSNFTSESYEFEIQDETNTSEEMSRTASSLGESLEGFQTYEVVEGNCDCTAQQNLETLQSEVTSTIERLQNIESYFEEEIKSMSGNNVEECVPPEEMEELVITYNYNETEEILVNDGSAVCESNFEDVSMSITQCNDTELRYTNIIMDGVPNHAVECLPLGDQGITDIDVPIAKVEAGGEGTQVDIAKIVKLCHESQLSEQRRIIEYGKLVQHRTGDEIYIAEYEVEVPEVSCNVASLKPEVSLPALMDNLMDDLNPNANATGPDRDLNIDDLIDFNGLLVQIICNSGTSKCKVANTINDVVQFILNDEESPTDSLTEFEDMENIISLSENIVTEVVSSTEGGPVLDISPEQEDETIDVQGSKRKRKKSGGVSTFNILIATPTRKEIFINYDEKASSSFSLVPDNDVKCNSYISTDDVNADFEDSPEWFSIGSPEKVSCDTSFESVSSNVEGGSSPLCSRLDFTQVSSRKKSPGPLAIIEEVEEIECGENTFNGDHSDAHQSTFSQSSKEGSPTKDRSTEESPKKEKKKKKGLRTPSFLKKKKEKKKVEA